MLQTVVDARSSCSVRNDQSFDDFEEYWVLNPMLQKSVAPDPDVVFPAFDEKFPASLCE